MKKSKRRLFTKKLNYARAFARSFFKWIIISSFVGLAGGIVGTLFRVAVEYANILWHAHTWLLYLLPVGGLVIVGFYRLCHVPNPIGTNRVIKAVRKEDEIPLVMAPLIFVSTVITHLLGGSAGREGAALQLGGTVGTQIGKLLDLDEKDMSLAVLSGMSGVFAALFGTPVTAVFFSLEVISVGVIYYSGLVPCLVSALVAYSISAKCGYGKELFPSPDVPQFDWITVLQVVAVGICCALVSILFILSLDRIRELFARFIKNPYIKVAVGGIAVIGLSLIFSSGDYNCSGIAVIFEALNGEVVWWAFLVKILFTAVTLGSGFKGGEIVPTFFIGSTLGCLVGSLIGLDPGFAAALGLAAIFCGVVNCPVASIILGVELFGSGGFVFFAIACCVSYMLSGYYGLYGSQKILYSKTKAEYININSK